MVWLAGSVQLEQHIRTQELHKKLGKISGTEETRWCRLRYFGLLQRIDNNVWQRRVNDCVVPGILPRPCPQLSWSDAITEDLNIRKELADKWVR